jgi:subtilase family serine protease
VVGGTSLACPMFSSLWAIAVQRAGHNLGQPAARIYDLDPSTITDVKPLTSLNNVTGIFSDARGPAPWNASFLAAPLQNIPDFYSALFNRPTGWWIVTFGTDSTLPVTDGYDLATGLGTPNGPDFVEAVAHAH